MTEPLWTADDVARYLVRTKKTVQNHIQYSPGFPKPIRMPTEKGRGHPRWVPDEVREWALSQREVA